MTKEKDNDTVYNWIKKVIHSCDDHLQIPSCELIIDNFRKKGGLEYQIKALNEEMKIQINEIKRITSQVNDPDLKQKVYDLFKTGNYTISEIKNKLNISTFKCNEIVDEVVKKGFNKNN